MLDEFFIPEPGKLKEVPPAVRSIYFFPFYQKYNTFQLLKGLINILG